MKRNDYYSFESGANMPPMQPFVVSVTALTSMDEVVAAASATVHGKTVRKVSAMFGARHSPIRARIFKVALDAIPTCVSVHFVRHKVGVEHFVSSNRPDRGGDSEADRWTPVKHDMIVNANALIEMAERRLCYKAMDATREVFEAIRYAIGHICPETANVMVPACVRQGGMCFEHPTCGRVDAQWDSYWPQLHPYVSSIARGILRERG